MNSAERVYKKLMEVPPGMVVSYGELARAAGIINGSRVVGRIMSQNPYPGIVPCHRVIMSDGRLGGYGYGGTHVKADMLQKEGVPIRENRIQDKTRMYYFPD
ncbi:MAG: MGMT family protein [Cenarchaeum sp. SB0665_bin_23]|nr:MGMT family protein [Cenarchaeum sp. SB0667_bin_13]MXY60633.1 MGMT family protein [Cenarchaeum sp. SB0665_bin_23]MXZ93852.1 MGMT family protein [Cenarchaeum sp. SB0666_bin_15]MYB47392.1 MGMT family protein [Cenarchaeum sp. SB0662_bin_33]MYC80173.1 MGMT family protein [Cenarchaeum sp. SB0661_bin_35]MYD58882.1 MGMT family protein [Cenarchaeum sp. SB0678_bin_8]MYG33166.1 MGMT family protein [Cenarchaeum sp. SB0677_bin_16]MYI52276.1 MGMT family protein [Cenarchaeum sp. SB0673_bin_9]MYJ28146.